MESQFGWTLLSRDALRRAETQLREDIEGVRDEIGFLALHQAYADRFFPGTSVLHTRLRYVLFVPWMYQRIVLNRSGERINDLLQKEELELTRRLRHLGSKHGVIGIRSYPKPTAQPPSMIYWTALAKWRILKPLASGAFPPRQALHRAIARKGPRQRLLDDDQQLLIEDEPFFGTLPPPPREWQSANETIDFRLQPTEAQFLRGCFLSVTRSEGDAAPSLLARLVDHQVPLADRDSLWSPKVRAAADDADRTALTRSRQAAALAAVGRAVYSAMVESMRAQYDGIRTEDKHRQHLVFVSETYAADALALNVDDITIDAPSLPKGILNVLRATQEWLGGRRNDVMKLHEVYEAAEYKRKDRRARLLKNMAGRERRAEWTPKDSALAEPLHYRWPQVRRMLLDLQGCT